MRRSRIDKPLLVLLALLVVSGAFIFSSAAFGLVARGSSHISSVVFNHLVLGVGIGLIAFLIGLAIDYRVWRRYSLYLFCASLLLTALVFIPGVGAEFNGSRSWLILFGFSFQPSEVLKVATILMLSTFYSNLRQKTATTYWGLGGFFALMLLPTALLILQPDVGTLGIIGIAALSVFIAAGARWRDIGIIVLAGMLAFGVLAMKEPHIRDRIATFIRPGEHQQAESYQIKQSLIAIGSGGFLGRGFGQGIQKFTYLPEPMGDSIYAVAGEELGFVGASAIVILFAAFAFRGLTIAARAPDLFGSLLATGISVYLAAEAYINISAMLGLAPLTGIPLTFMSQGGSAILVALGSAGILLNVSMHRQQK